MLLYSAKRVYDLQDRCRPSISIGGIKVSRWYLIASNWISTWVSEWDGQCCHLFLIREGGKPKELKKYSWSSEQSPCLYSTAWREVWGFIARSNVFKASSLGKGEEAQPQLIVIKASIEYSITWKLFSYRLGLANICPMWMDVYIMFSAFMTNEAGINYCPFLWSSWSMQRLFIDRVIVLKQ